MTELEKYYNKFNEEKRLTSRHGKVEFITSMKYIDQMKTGKDIKTLYKTEIEMKNKLKGK